MNSLEVYSCLLGLSVLVALGGAILCLTLFWMLRQQKFLHELFRTLHDLERRNREAQRDLFLILRSYLGFREVPTHGQVEGVGPENRSAVSRDKESEAGGRNQELTLDEVQLLVALSTGEPKSLAEIRKSAKDFDDPEARLRLLRDKGFIFYSDGSDVVVVLPKALPYLGVNPETTAAQGTAASQKTAAISIRSGQAHVPSLFSPWPASLSLLVASLVVLSFVWLRGGIGFMWQWIEEPPSSEIPFSSEALTEPFVPSPFPPPSSAKAEVQETNLFPIEAPPTEPPGSLSPTQTMDVTPAPIEAPPSTLSPLRTERPSATAPHLLRMQAKEEAWIRTTIDGEQTKEILLKPGEKVEWSAWEGFILTLGNAGGVTLTFNGRELPPLGVSGQVIHNLQLPPLEERG